MFVSTTPPPFSFVLEIIYLIPHIYRLDYGFYSIFSFHIPKTSNLLNGILSNQRRSECDLSSFHNLKNSIYALLAV